MFQGREPASPIQPRAAVAPRRAPDVQAPPDGPLPPPLAYVGKVARDGEGFAVLAREERVYMVRVGDAVGNGYRVQSISEKEVVILNADFGMTQTLFFSTAANAVLPADTDPTPTEPAPTEPAPTGTRDD